MFNLCPLANPTGIQNWHSKVVLEGQIPIPPFWVEDRMLIFWAKLECRNSNSILRCRPQTMDLEFGIRNSGILANMLWSKRALKELEEIMDVSLIHNVRHKNRPKMKRELVEPLEDDPRLALSSVLDGVLHLENVRSYLRCKLETISDSDFTKEF